jgi:DNA-binding Lrp family transcriptional regulator
MQSGLAFAGFLRDNPAMGELLDDRDRRILELLQADAWLTYADLAQRVHLSASATQRRVERLIQRGVILGARIRLAADVMPARPLTILLLVELRDDSAATLQLFTKVLAGSADVVEAHYVTGEADVAVKLRVRDMKEYDRFVERYINGLPMVRRFKTLASLRALKSSE